MATRRQRDRRLVPPWGTMDEGLLGNINDQPVPLDWRSDDGPPANSHQRWLQYVTQEIATKLWPLYDPNGSAWQSSTVKQLFDADFRLLEPLHAHLLLPIDAMFSTTVSHSTFFDEEDDDNNGFGMGYGRYDPTLSRPVADQFREVLKAGYSNKVGSIGLRLKQVFQRPRAWQMALIQGRRTYKYRWAHTADTPSLVSGHCLQGMIAACTVFSDLGPLMTRQSLEVLAQFATDIGDRRVFAGVHYPSDSLSSWYVASKLVPFVFRRPQAAEVKRFMGKAIENSPIYAAIEDDVKQRPRSSPYAPMLAALHSSLDS